MGKLKDWLEEESRKLDMDYWVKEEKKDKDPEIEESAEEYYGHADKRSNFLEDILPR